MTQNNTKYKYISKLPTLKGHRKPLGFFRCSPKGQSKIPTQGFLEDKVYKFQFTEVTTTKLFAEFLWLRVLAYVQVGKPQRRWGEVRRE